MLSDAQKRAAYDQYGHAGVDPNMGGVRGGPGAEGFGGFAEAFGDIFGDIFGGAAGGGAAARRRPAGLPRQRPELRDGDHARRSRARQGNADPHPELGELRDLPRHRRQARHQRQDLHAPATARARCTCARASSASSRPARTATAPARSFPSPAPPATAQGKIKKQQDAGGEDPGRHQRRHAHPLGRQRRAGHQRRPGGRPVHRDPHQAARDLRARRRRPALHGAGGPDHRRAGRQRSRCPRWAARPRSSCPKARSTARPSACAARASRACARATRATCTATSRSRRRSSSPSTSASC